MNDFNRHRLNMIMLFLALVFMCMFSSFLCNLDDIVFKDPDLNYYMFRNGENRK